MVLQLSILGAMPALSGRRDQSRRPFSPSENRFRRDRHVTLNANKVYNIPSTNSIFVFGLNGYCALGLGNILAAKGWSVSGTFRNPSSEEHLINKGWRAFRFDPGFRQTLSEEAVLHLGTCSHVLSSIPPLGLPLYDPALHEQMKLLKGCEQLAWVGYLSSTVWFLGCIHLQSVYGDWGGDWVDESCTCRPGTSRGIVRRAAEEAWQQAQHSQGLPVHIFRLGGIYGPGRSALEAAREASATASASKQRRARQKYTSRCHVLDICRVVEASMLQPNPGAVYNVVDDEPAPRQEVVHFAKSLLMAEQQQHAQPQQQQQDGQQRLQQQQRQGCGDNNCPGTQEASPYEGNAEGQDATSGMTSTTEAASTSGVVASKSLEPAEPTFPSGSRSRSREFSEGGTEASGSGSESRSRRQDVLEEKRVRNDLIKDQLGVQLLFPSYREGISALHAGDIRPFDLQDLQLLTKGRVAGQDRSSEA